MINQKFDCPKCGAKNSAHRSSYYPQIVVHKCDGKILFEVGRFDNGQCFPVEVSHPSSQSKIYTHQFLIEKITQVSSLVKYGQQLNNVCSQQSSAQKYLNDGEIYVVFLRNREDAKYMILIQNQNIPDIQFFSGKNVSQIEKQDGEEILQALIKAQLVSKNPFPNLYRI